MEVVSGDAFKQLLKAGADLFVVAHRLSQKPYHLVTAGDTRELRACVRAWTAALARLEKELDP